MNPKLFVLGAILLVCSIFNQAMGQSLQVSGTVKDKATGTALSDATVSIKGSATRTKTNAQGEFTIKVAQKGAVLSISYVGMKTVDYTVNNAGPVSIELESSSTTLEDVVWQIGKSGVVSPVAILSPITIGGAVVARATLHNIEYIRDLNLEIGCQVEVVRSGEIIPRVLRRIE